MRDSDWPSFLRTTKVRSDSCRLDGNEDGFGLPPLSGDYVRLRPARRGPARATARLAVDGPPGTAGFYVIDRRGRGPAIEHLLSFDADGVGIAEVPFGRRAINRITVGLANASAPGAAAIGYSLRLRGENRVTLSPPSGVSATNFGTGVILSGSVECRGRPAPFADVLITVREIVSGEEQVFEVETNEFGRWSLGFTPEANSRIIAEVIDPLLSSARSEPTGNAGRTQR